jgi:hypothetical protein
MGGKLINNMRDVKYVMLYDKEMRLIYPPPCITFLSDAIIIEPAIDLSDYLKRKKNVRKNNK